MSNGYTVVIRSTPNRTYETWLPYLPRVGDELRIHNDGQNDDQKILKGVVTKVVYWENSDTKAGESNFDVYIE